jgi:hypothetical protein
MTEGQVVQGTHFLDNITDIHRVKVRPSHTVDHDSFGCLFGKISTHALVLVVCLGHKDRCRVTSRFLLPEYRSRLWGCVRPMRG